MQKKKKRNAGIRQIENWNGNRGRGGSRYKGMKEEKAAEKSKSIRIFLVFKLMSLHFSFLSIENLPKGHKYWALP